LLLPRRPRAGRKAEAVRLFIFYVVNERYSVLQKHRLLGNPLVLLALFTFNGVLLGAVDGNELYMNAYKKQYTNA
jgi:hypothetical protein